ncbi:orf E (apicoplast) [Besnoitia besnoiti]|uniref:Orf E n=1 Tax=Besnoitia besnoiti TaxID=94643 RepID=A0A2A9M3W5_BESBE|nr:orf E [Besnoitia besnoiti]PFH30586.1 orf E [Besnoitia besnoiti]
MLFKKYIFLTKLFFTLNKSNKKKLYFNFNFFKKIYSKYFFQQLSNNYFIFYSFPFDFQKIQLQKNFSICIKKKFKNNLLNLNFIRFKKKNYIFYNFYMNFLHFNL